MSLSVEHKTKRRRLRFWAGLSIAAVSLLGGWLIWRTTLAGPRWEAIEAAVVQKRWADAEADLKRWVVRHPEDDAAWLNLAGVYLTQKRYDLSVEALANVKGSASYRSRAQTVLGEVRIQQRRAAEAERAFRQAVELEPRDTDPKRRLAYLLNLELRTEEARPVLWQLYRQTGDARHILTIAGQSVAQPDARDPSPELDQYLKQTPDDPLLQRAQGLRLLHEGKPVEALPFLERASAAIEDDAPLRLAIAECRILAGKTEDIEAILGPEPASARDRGQWWLLKGEADEANGKLDDAIAAWRRAIEVHPDDRAALYRLGRALAHRGKTEEAKPLLEQAEAIRVREVTLFLLLDRYLRGQRHADLFEELARICQGLGLKPEARAWIEQAVKADPARPSVQRSLAALSGTPDPAPVAPPRMRASRGRIAGSSPPVASARPAAPPLRFEPAAQSMGIVFDYQSGASGNLFIADMMGGGVCLIDYDNDGWLDVYFMNGCPLPYDEKHPPRPNKLFHNRRDGTFEDVTERAGVGGIGYGMGCAVGDYDNDGFDDLFVTGLSATVLYRNRGDGTFEDVTQHAGVLSSRWTTAAGFADLDGDGDLDLVVISYVDADARQVLPCEDSLGHRIHCPPGRFVPQWDHLFRNNGDGTFTDVSKPAGFEIKAGDPPVPAGPGLGLAIADLDGDDRLDLFVANDATPNFLFRNLGDLKFEEVGALAGLAYEGSGKATASMGVIAEDMTEDGLIDLLHTNFVNESCTLLQNLGGGQFSDITAHAGLAAPTKPMTGFGAVALDVNNDGHLDLFLANGHVDDHPWENRPMAQLPQLFAGRGEGRFELAEPAISYFQTPVVGRGVAAGDLDNDGRVDLIVVHRDAPAAVLRNVTEGGHWLGLRLRGKSPRTPVGARVTCEVDEKKMVRWWTSGTSYLSSSDPRLFFGLRSSRGIDRLEVRWPSGLVQSWKNVAANRILTLEEGADLDPPAEPHASAHR